MKYEDVKNRVIEEFIRHVDKADKGCLVELYNYITREDIKLEDLEKEDEEYLHGV